MADKSFTDADSDNIVSMVDVLHDEELLQEDADAVLGASDATVCTYLQGYVARQALYACKTCISDDMEPAGVCLACSLECHDGHNLVELYTKRSFRCDCGNSKFKSAGQICRLCPNKTPQNVDNLYNQNYRGLYCTCHRPYPDPNDSVDDVMLQCVICEDWLHGRHLGGSQVPDVDFEEMTCQLCTDRCSFLRHYTSLTVDSETTDVDIVNDGNTSHDIKQQQSVSSCVSSDDNVAPAAAASEVTDSVMTSVGCQCQPAVMSVDKSAAADCVGSTSTAVTDPTLVNKPSGDGPCDVSSCRDGPRDDTSCQAGTSGEECCLAQLPKSESTGALFWRSSWRTHLCRCSRCLSVYDHAGVNFLLDVCDTIAVYEERGKQTTSCTSYQRSLEAFATKLDRVQQMEMLHGYSDLKSQLTDYLKKFADNKKVVREEDVKEFFDGFAARKRQRTD